MPDSENHESIMTKRQKVFEEDKHNIFNREDNLFDLKQILTRKSGNMQNLKKLPLKDSSSLKESAGSNIDQPLSKSLTINSRPKQFGQSAIV